MGLLQPKIEYIQKNLTLKNGLRYRIKGKKFDKSLTGLAIQMEEYCKKNNLKFDEVVTRFNNYLESNNIQYPTLLIFSFQKFIQDVRKDKDFISEYIGKDKIDKWKKALGGN